MAKYYSGQEIGDLTLISFSGIKWLTKCKCGNIWETRTSRLNNRTSCPKCTPQVEYHHYKPGTVVENNILLERLPTRKWKMQCPCGAIRIGSPCDLKRYKTCQACYQSDVGGKKKRLPNNQALLNNKLRYYQRAATSRNLSWKLTDAQFFELIQKNCTYCGVSPNTTNQRKDMIIHTNGIDRIKNTEGYTISNSVPCCNFCNHAKKNHSVEYFLQKIIEIYKFND